MKYKNYSISLNEYNYYEAISYNCDDNVIIAKTIEEIKEEIDEK